MKGNSQRLTGKIALVTGAASGIGAATAQRLAAEGAKVTLADLNEPELARVAEVIRLGGGQAFAVRLDVTSEADWEAAVGRILADWGPLDILVNCAGIAFAKPVVDLELDDWRRVMTTNLDGVFLGTKHALRAMSASSGGCIINVASAAGIKPISGNAAYGTSKAAIRFFTQIAALEGKPHGVRVNSVSPGAVATPMWQLTEMWPKDIADAGGREAALKALAETRGFAKPEEVASAVVFLASDEARRVTGADLVMDDGFALG